MYVVFGGPDTTWVERYRPEGEMLEKLVFQIPRGSLGKFITQLRGVGDALIVASGPEPSGQSFLTILQDGGYRRVNAPVFGWDLRQPNFVAQDGQGRLYVAGGFSGLCRVDTTGNVVARIGGDDTFWVRGVLTLRSGRILLLTNKVPSWAVWDPQENRMSLLGTGGEGGVSQFAVSGNKLYVAGMSNLAEYLVPGEDSTAVMPPPPDTTGNGGGVMPEHFALWQNYPNPFNPSTTIRFDLPQSGQVLIEVFDAVGRRVETLVSGSAPSGQHEVRWIAADLPSGIYFYRLRVDNNLITTRKAVLMK